MTATGHPEARKPAGQVQQFTLEDEGATAALGAALAGLMVTGDVVCLFGDLGAGKTTLARALIQALGHKGAVPSPTYTLVQHYELDGLAVAHFDLYRLADAEEVFELGIDDARHAGAVLIEWPEIALHLLPAERLDVRLEDAGGGRLATLTGGAGWATRLSGLDVRVA